MATTQKLQHLGSGARRQRRDRRVPQARSARDGQEPGDVRRRGRRRADDDAAGPRPARRAAAASASSCRSRCGCGPRCCSPTSPRRWPKGAARRRPTRCARPRPRPSRIGSCNGADGDGAGRVAAQGRRRHGARRRVHPGRRRDHRRRRVGRRIGDHRRVRAGHSRGRRRSLGGHRRHARAVGLDQGPGHRRPGPDVPRSHDRAGRRRRAAEDAERDRAQHPAGRPDDRLPDGGRHAAAVRDLLRARRSRCSCWCRCWSA